MAENADNPNGIDIAGAKKDAAKASALQRASFKPRTPSIASQAQNIFQGASKGMEAAMRAAQFGDPQIAFLAGAGGAFGGPSAQEIENAVVQREIQAEQDALMQAPLGQLDPNLADQLSQQLGYDASDITIGQFQKMQGTFQAADGFNKMKESIRQNTPLDKTGAQFWADLTTKDAKMFVGKTPKEIEMAFNLAGKFNKAQGLGAGGPIRTIRKNDIEALKASEAAELGRPLTSEENARFDAMEGVNIRFRPNLFTPARELASEPFARIAAAAGIPIIDKITGKERLATPVDLAQLSAKDVRGSIIASKRPTFFRSVNGRETYFVTTRDGRIITRQEVGVSSTFAKEVVDANQEADGAQASLKIIERLAEGLITAKKPANLGDFQGIFDQFKQGVKIKLESRFRTNGDAVAFEKALDTFLASLARASGERGVLTEQDVNRIKGSLPTAFDNEDTFAVGIRTMSDMFEAVRLARIRAVGEIGRDKGKNLNLDYDKTLREYREFRDKGTLQELGQGQGQPPSAQGGRGLPSMSDIDAAIQRKSGGNQ